MNNFMTSEGFIVGIDCMVKELPEKIEEILLICEKRLKNLGCKDKEDLIFPSNIYYRNDELYAICDIWVKKYWDELNYMEEIKC